MLLDPAWSCVTLPDQALNLVTRVSDTSNASRTSDVSTDLDALDAMDDLDVATDVATNAHVRRVTKAPWPR